MSDIKSGTIGRNTQQGEGEASSVAVNVEDIVNEIRAQLNGGGSVPTSGQVYCDGFEKHEE